MPQTNIYLRNDQQWILSSLSRTTAGVWVANGVVHRLPRDCSLEELGAALLASLAASQEGVPHPTNWAAFRREYQEALGAYNMARFEAESKLVTLSQVPLQEGAAFKLTPTRYDSSKKGYDPLKSTTKDGPLTPAELGQALLDCVARCL